MSADELGLEAKVASMAEQYRRVLLDWEIAVIQRDEARAENARLREELARAECEAGDDR